jgi:hypothetical protein
VNLLVALGYASVCGFCKNSFNGDHRGRNWSTGGCDGAVYLVAIRCTSEAPRLGTRSLRSGEHGSRHIAGVIVLMLDEEKHLDAVFWDEEYREGRAAPPGWGSMTF